MRAVSTPDILEIWVTPLLSASPVASAVDEDTGDVIYNLLTSVWYMARGILFTVDDAMTCGKEVVYLPINRWLSQGIGNRTHGWL